MSIEPQPTINRIVTYRKDTEVDCPAIIARVPEDESGAETVDLFVFDIDYQQPHRRLAVPYSEEPTARTWRWPERSGA